MWSADEEQALQPFAPPEILEGDLAPLALDLAVAGVTDPSELSWLDAPPPGAFAQATELLRQLEAIDDTGRITPHGQAMARFGMHPRLAHMLIRGAASGATALACDLAALLGERDPLRALRDTVGSDVRSRIDALHRPREYPAVDRGVLRPDQPSNRATFDRD